MAKAPPSFDWVKKGKVTPVKNQGDCNLCFGFAAVAAVESHYAIKHGVLIPLSEKFLLDCGKWQCDGKADTTPENAWQFIKKIGGIPAESLYKPYTDKPQKEKCDKRRTEPSAKLTGYKENVATTEEGLKEYIRTKGPVVARIMISDDNQSFRQYKADSGIYDDVECKAPARSSELNHAVLIVGYGEDPVTNKKYWKSKIHGGKNGGKDGFMLISRGNNRCGISMLVSHPVVSPFQKI